MKNGIPPILENIFTPLLIEITITNPISFTLPFEYSAPTASGNFDHSFPHSFQLTIIFQKIANEERKEEFVFIINFIIIFNLSFYPYPHFND